MITSGDKTDECMFQIEQVGLLGVEIGFICLIQATWDSVLIKFSLLHCVGLVCQAQNPVLESGIMPYRLTPSRLLID